MEHPATLTARLFGGPPSVHFQQAFPQSLTENDQRELLGIVRRVLRVQGEAREVVGALEWSVTDRPNEVTVVLSPQDDGAVVQITGDQRVVAGVTWGVCMSGSLLAGVIIAQSLNADLLTGLGILAGVGGVGAVTARTIWSVISANFRRKLERLRDEISRFLAR